MFRFEPWDAFGANLDRKTIRNWLTEVRKEARRVFTEGLRQGPHTGRIYARANGRFHQASINRARQEFPANDSGRLLASMKDRQTVDTAVIGTNTYYAIFLRMGTSKMRARRMSKEAMLAGAKEAQPHSKGWVKYRKGVQRVRSLN